MSNDRKILKGEFVPPGAIQVSRAALEYARDFIAMVAADYGDHIATFDWSQQITGRASPDAEPQPIDDCLILGASARSNVPQEVIHAVDGMEFAVELPREILQASVQRLIDFDKNAFFKLVLR
jgi:hypothetical protein